MLAIPISRGIEPIAFVSAEGKMKQVKGLCRSQMRLILVLIFYLWNLSFAADAYTRPELVAISEKRFQEAHTRFLTETNSAEAAWQFARTCFDRAEFATNNSER